MIFNDVAHKLYCHFMDTTKKYKWFVPVLCKLSFFANAKNGGDAGSRTRVYQ